MVKTEQSLIAYADFSDYLPIIERGDRIFKAVFNRETNVQEFFIRLYLIRICTMQDLRLPERAGEQESGSRA